MAKSSIVFGMVLVLLPFGPTSAEDKTSHLLIGPVLGLTSTWHAAPPATFVPLGSVVLFKITFPRGAPCTWIGAEEYLTSDHWSIARCRLTEIGERIVEVEVYRSQWRKNYSCTLNVVNFDANRIVVAPPTACVDPLRVDENSSNEHTMQNYFGESIASLRKINDLSYRTSVDREILMQVEVSPPGFGPLMEWRIDGDPVALGESIRKTFSDIGMHTITVGPLVDTVDGTSLRTNIETYSVMITSHQSSIDIVPEGVPIIFEAVTDPPGYEEEITWLSSTKYGTAVPVLGHGRTFTVVFNDTYGPHPDGGVFQWLGVKANNVKFSQDQKTFDEFCSTGEITIRIFENVLFPGQMEFEETISLSSEGLSNAVVVRASPPYTDCVDADCVINCPTIDTEIMNLELSGVSPTLGNIVVRERDDRVSGGEICCVDADAEGNFLSGDSYFNVAVEIEAVDFGVVLDTGDHPVRLQAEDITSLPPFGSDYIPQPPIGGVCEQPGGPQTIPLFPAGTSVEVGEITHAAHQPVVCAKVQITDTFDQELPSVVETFWQVEFSPRGEPPVNEIGFKAKIINLRGLSVSNYNWTIDGPMGDLTPLGGINTGQDASYTCCGTALNHPMPPANTTLTGLNACAVEFKSWIGATGVGSKAVKVDVTLSNADGSLAGVITDEIEVKVLSYLTETVPGVPRAHSLLEEHYGWHSCFDSGNCDAGSNAFLGVGAAADLQGADYKNGYLFLKFHRRFAVTEFAAYRTAAGLGPVPQTPHIPLVFPYPLRTGGGLGPGGDCPLTGSSDPQTITLIPAALNPPTGFATSHALGGGAALQAWHEARHSDYCSHGDVVMFTSPRDISLYWFHKMIDSVWTVWLNANPMAPHFYVVVANRDPGPGASITQADLSNVGIFVTFSDAVTGVVGADLTLTDAAGTKVATSVSGSGVGPYAFKFLDVPDPGLVTVTLKKGTFKHQDPTDPVTPKRDNPLENDVCWQVTIL